MNLSKLLSVLTLIAFALLLSAERSASNNLQPNEHQKTTNKEPQTTEPLQSGPSVPPQDLEATRSALLYALRALHAEQEARDKDKGVDCELLYANLISLGLLVVGIVY